MFDILITSNSRARTEAVERNPLDNLRMLEGVQRVNLPQMCGRPPDEVRDA